MHAWGVASILPHGPLPTMEKGSHWLVGVGIEKTRLDGTPDQTAMARIPRRVADRHMLVGKVEEPVDRRRGCKSVDRQRVHQEVPVPLPIDETPPINLVMQKVLDLFRPKEVQRGHKEVIVKATEFPFDW